MLPSSGGWNVVVGMQWTPDYESEGFGCEDESLEEAQGVLILKADAVLHAICRRLIETCDKLRERRKPRSARIRREG